MTSTPKRPHTVADHAHGSELEHSHDEDSDHDHDHDVGPSGPIEENALWQADNITLTSVGIDIGSSRPQVIFSRLRMRPMGGELSSPYFVLGPDTPYESPGALTPHPTHVPLRQHAARQIHDDA